VQSPKWDQARVLARVTNDAAATPRTTLKDGLVQHQWGFGLGSRMPVRFYCLTVPGCSPRVSGPMYRDASREPLKADTTYGCRKGPLEGGHYVRLSKRSA
jgi:hypothetical protein